MHKVSMPSWQSVFLPQNVQQFCSPVHLCTRSMPTWQSSHRILNDSGPPSTSQQSSSLCNSHTHAQCPLELYRTPQRFYLLNSQQSSSNCTSCLRSMPTWKSSTELTTKFCLQLCFSHTALPPEVFSNLTGLLPELMIPILCLSTPLSEPAAFRSASSVHGIQRPQYSVTPSWHETSKTFTLEIKHTPAECINTHTFTA
jgi:hypothetical protein